MLITISRCIYPDLLIWTLGLALYVILMNHTCIFWDHDSSTQICARFYATLIRGGHDCNSRMTEERFPTGEVSSGSRPPVPGQGAGSTAEAPRQTQANHPDSGHDQLFSSSSASETLIYTFTTYKINPSDCSPPFPLCSHEHTTPLLQNHHWFSSSQIQVLLLPYNNESPSSVTALLHSPTPFHSLHSSSSSQIRSEHSWWGRMLPLQRHRNWPMPPQSPRRCSGGLDSARVFLGLRSSCLSSSTVCTSLLTRLLVLSPQHVHVHVLPRKLGDFERNDSVYDEVSVRIFDCLFRRQTAGATHTRDPHGTRTCTRSRTQRCVL